MIFAKHVQIPGVAHVLCSFMGVINTAVRKTRRLSFGTVYTVAYQKIEHRSQWLRRRKLRSAAARLLELWVQIPPGAWRSVWCECCVLSSRVLCDGLITRTWEPDRVLVCQCL
jgi:hypothetical protein